MVAEPN